MESATAVCMLCSGSGFDFYHRVRDDAERWAGRCRNCGHVQIIPLPSQEEDEKYYQHNDQIRNVVPHSLLDDEQLVAKYEAVGRWQIHKAMKMIAPGATVLEIGSGYGWFVQLMRQEGYHVDGIEVSAERRESMELRTGIKLFGINLAMGAPGESLGPNGPYDAIWMSHVLEHIIDPQVFLKKAVRYLRDGGKIFITVPNLHDYNKTVVKEYDDFCYLRAHVAYYTPETLSRLMRQCGISDVVISGDQLYGVENAFHWVREKKPFPASFQIGGPPGFEFLDDFYKSHLESQLISCAIIGSGTYRAVARGDNQ